MYTMKITPAIPPKTRKKIEELLKAEGCRIERGTTCLIGESFSDVEFDNHRFARVKSEENDDME